jgi:hypothetical protein
MCDEVALLLSIRGRKDFLTAPAQHLFIQLTDPQLDSFEVLKRQHTSPCQGMESSVMPAALVAILILNNQQVWHPDHNKHTRCLTSMDVTRLVKPRLQWRPALAATLSNVCKQCNSMLSSTLEQDAQASHQPQRLQLIRRPFQHTIQSACDFTTTPALQLPITTGSCELQHHSAKLHNHHTSFCRSKHIA